MGKKLKHESFVYHFLQVAKNNKQKLESRETIEKFESWVDSLSFRYQEGKTEIHWPGNKSKIEIPLSDFKLYRHGKKNMSNDGGDNIKKLNLSLFNEVFFNISEKAGFNFNSVDDNGDKLNQKLQKEEIFHDKWAEKEKIEYIDVRQVNEAITSPELRYIRETLGDIKGKSLLDVGCGLGEASVYFALEGANVTAMDISQGMLDCALKLAVQNRVDIKTHKSAAEQTNLPDDRKYDIIYAGNLLHHVDIEKTLKMLKPYLAKGGILITWDPLAYNPIINLYRILATDVRTPDEHPLTWSDIRLFYKNFDKVETRYFWLTTLFIFIIMAVFQKRNPNKERYWKSVVEEAPKWERIYRPLATIDRFLLKLFPPLRLLCWNVVIKAQLRDSETN